MGPEQTRLPIDAFRKTIEDSVAQNTVTIITAETGAGKSTRVPLWMWRNGQHVHITQPRRIATRSLSYYMSKLTAGTWGNEVGYQTGFDRKCSRQTRLLYLTDGIQMIQEIKRLHHYDVLIIDEIHEWNLNQEVLIGLVKDGLEKNIYQKKNKRIIIMSATLEADKLSAFLQNAPIISVPGRGFPVTMHHNHPHFLLSDTVQMVGMAKNVLVFQPGKKEINDFMQILNETLEHDKIKAKILPLHSELSVKEQSKVFQHYSIPKVIAATDIAQTSLTIDDIDAVIDTGIKKEIRNNKGIEGLYPIDISRSECLQRAGRAGRVKSGQYILCAEANIEDRLPYPEPELRRLNLESVVLRFIKWGISPLDFPYFHSPKSNLIHKALNQLIVFGAIRKNHTITPDGQKMAELPVSIRSARLLLEAMKGSRPVLDNALKIIAIVETRGITNKDFLGMKMVSSTFRSDLLNQLFIWNGEKLNKKMISYKKLSLAKEIYRELKNRIKINELKLNRKQASPDNQTLFRAILSSFSDHIFFRSGTIYSRDKDEERHLDRKSTLFETKPEMVTGLPFDLVIHKENQLTGEKEKIFLPLITFASEVSLDLLEKLKPFSYNCTRELFIKDNCLSVTNIINFGRKLIATFNSPPNWQQKSEQREAVKLILSWISENLHKYPLYAEMIRLKKHFPDLKKRFGKELKGFSSYWSQFIRQEIETHFIKEDIDFFLKSHPGFQHITYKKLIPNKYILLLQKSHWPLRKEIGDSSLPVTYIKGKPFIAPPLNLFQDIQEEDLYLLNGEQLGIILENRKFTDWEYAVYTFNRLKKVDNFNKKWKHKKKECRPEDIENIPFPQVFLGGRDKNNIQFEYFAAPEIEKDRLFLIHFLDRAQAQNYFDKIKGKFQKWMSDYKRKKIENIFSEKGWKVKP